MARPVKKETAASALDRAVALLRANALRTCFAPEDLNSRASPPQEEVLRGIQKYLIRYCISGNQGGKTTLAIRELTWLLTDSHPYFEIPPEWGTGPRTYIIAGQDRSQLENMWQTRILPFLNKDEWKEIRSGSALQSVQHRDRGDQIILLSHNNSSENDIKHMQYYSAHWVWVDEMPKSPRVLEELQRRVDARRGRFLCTFTMKVRNDKIRLLVDASDGVVSRKYKLGKFDNPIYAARRDEELAKLIGVSEQQKAAILNGEWITSDTQVYDWDPVLHGGAPTNYSPAWRHVLVVDPATESKLGMTIWAESPVDQIWWCIHASYVEGIHVPSRIVAEVERRAANVNIVRRIYDTEAAWYAHQASEVGYKYWPIPNKSGNKDRFIVAFKEALGPKIKIASWCVDLIAELNTCERSETSPDKIANASRYHLIDTAHYFVQMRPPQEEHVSYSSRAHFLIEQDNKRRVQEAAATATRGRQYLNTRYARRWSRR